MVWGQLNFICKNVFLCVNWASCKKRKAFAVSYITRYRQTVGQEDLATKLNEKINQIQAGLVVVGVIILMVRLIVTNPLGNDQPNDNASAEGRHSQ